MSVAAGRPPRLSARIGSIALAAAAGMCFPFQSRANGALGIAIGSPIGAAAVSFGGGFLLLAAAALVAPALRRSLVGLVASARQRRFPVWYPAAGVLGAFLVYAQSSAVPVVGVALVSVVVIAGQTTSGLTVDRIGFGTGSPMPLTLGRVAGVVLTLVAAAWSVAGNLHAEAGWITVLVVLLPLLGGALNGFQQAMNGAMTRAVGGPFAPTFANFLTGATVLMIGWGLQEWIAPSTPTAAVQWWMLLGGPLGIVFIAASAFLVPRLGVLLVSVCVVAGQLFGSLLCDAVFPTTTAAPGLATFGSIALTLVAVVLTSGLAGRLRRSHRD